MNVLSSRKSKITTTALAAILVLNSVLFAAEPLDKRQVQKIAVTSTGRVERPVRPVKNVILLIPDGCSLATVSAARWYQWLLDAAKPALNVDPYICGTVRTNSINAPIGDSAPTTSTYMTGELSRTGYVATYPPADPGNDIFKVDSTQAYQPMMTVMEASRILYGKSTGLVFTCEFPHATPADCSAHDYYRGNYFNIAEQMVNNQLDVVMGGGVKYLRDNQKEILRKRGYTVQTNDLNAFRSFKGKKIWSLFGDVEMPFDADRDTTKIPSLAEMTQKAIATLSANKNGFVMMVEGSKVDWAAHANDPMGMVTEFLAFDKACRVALDFAKKDGNTAVLILPDHGNSGISIGTSRLPGYDRLTKDQLFSNLLKFKRTAAGIADVLNESPRNAAQELFRKYAGFELTIEDHNLLDKARDYSKSPIPDTLRAKNESLDYTVARIMNQRTGIGFTTNGHTAEEVFVANFHPKGDILNGVHFGFEVNDYLCSLNKLDGKLPALTKQYFAKHTDVFSGMDCKIKPSGKEEQAVLTVTNGSKTLVARQNSNVVTLNGKEISLPTVVVYVDKNKTFYLPENLAGWMK